jgi:hypothetical protein
VLVCGTLFDLVHILSFQIILQNKWSINNFRLPSNSKRQKSIILDKYFQALFKKNILPLLSFTLLGIWAGSPTSKTPAPSRTLSSASTKGMQVRGPAPKAPSTLSDTIKFCMHQLRNQLSSFIVSNRVAGATSTTEVPSSHDDEGLWQSP